jgi:hypothetical protein
MNNVLHILLFDRHTVQTMEYPPCARDGNLTGIRREDVLIFVDDGAG